MAKLTITEALAELKTLNARLAKQRQFATTYIVRNSQLRDPLEKDGGSAKVLNETMQSIGDLSANILSIRRAIAAANASTEVTLEGTTRTIQEWLVWRKEVAPTMRTLYQQLVMKVNSARADATSKGGSLVTNEKETKPQDIIVALNERELSTQQELIEKMLGALDGQLSLKNATTIVEF